MFTDRPVLRAVSCLNQQLSLSFFVLQSQNQFPVGNLTPHQQGWPHDLGALEMWNTPGLINDTGLGPVSGREATWHRNQQLHPSCVLETVPGPSWLPDSVWELFDATWIGSWQEQCLVPITIWYSQTDPRAWTHTLTLFYLLEIQSLQQVALGSAAHFSQLVHAAAEKRNNIDPAEVCPTDITLCSTGFV